MSQIRDLWEEYGKNDPYFAVMTVDANRKANLGEAAREAFFQSGFDHLEMIWDVIDSSFGVEFRPERSLDLGCGVGRITIPMATRSGHVTAVDIADNMLLEAKRNCEISDVANVEFKQTDRYLDSDGSYDFVHSFITLQHIEPSLGIRIVRKMIESLNHGGIGALHFTYKATGGRFARFRSRLYRDVPLIYRLRRAFAKGETGPYIPVYLYDLNAIMAELQAGGCHRVAIRFSDHSILGAMVIFRKETLPSV